MSNFRSHFVSALVTFGSVFLTTAAAIIASVPQETWNSPEVYTSAFWLSLGTAILRGLVRPVVALFVRNYYK